MTDTYTDCRDWFAGALVHLHLAHHYKSPCSNSYKLAQSYDDMHFKSQDKIEYGDRTIIRTVVASDERYEVVHDLIWHHNESGFEVETIFINRSEREFTLEMLTSASLDNLSPYREDDSSKNVLFHTFES